MSELKRKYVGTLTVPGLAFTGSDPARTRKKYKAPTRKLILAVPTLEYPPATLAAGGWLEDAATPTPPPQPLLSRKVALRCLIFDNDETTGDYQLGSLLFAIGKKFCPEWLRKHFINEYLVKLHGARPGTKELLKMAYDLKEKGKLDHIVLFTAASNATGWVTFLAESLADYAEIPQNAISLVVSVENCQSPVISGGRIVKDLRLICTDASNVIIVEDKPEFVRGPTETEGDGGGVYGSCISVPEYRVPGMDIDHLVKAMPLSEPHRAIALNALKEDAEKYPPIKTDIRQHADTALYPVIKTVETFYA